jgi:AcrR family transcriptional regulator
MTGTRRYASAAMQDRRLRILAEAQALLDEHGVDGFTIRELSRRAGVAQRTLYNVFGSKEDIVASAIELHFMGMAPEFPPPPPGEDLRAYLDRMEVILDRTINLRRYATAMVTVFFSPTADRRIYDSLRRISDAGSGAWVRRAVEGQLLKALSPLDRERLSTLLVNMGYANITDWAAGRITGGELKTRFKLNHLIAIRPHVRAPHRAMVDGLLRRLRGDRRGLGG